MSYLKGFGTRRVPQWVPPAGQSANSAGGHAWTVDVWTRLRRFLILGSEGGSYHASEPALTRENASAVDDAVREDGLRAVEGFRGWGRSPRRAVAGWYVSQSPNALAYQAVKYGNLATMTRVGVIAPGSTGTAQAVAKLGGAERIRAARVHPIALLAALRTYASSRGACGHGTWSPVREIVDALDGAFYASFRNVVPAGTRLLLALDVSGSMTYGEIAGVPGLSPRDASAALTLVTAATEQRYEIVGFFAGGNGFRKRAVRYTAATSTALRRSRSRRDSGWTTLSGRCPTCRSAAPTARCRCSTHSR